MAEIAVCVYVFILRVESQINRKFAIHTLFGSIEIIYGYIFLAGYLYKMMQTGDSGKFLKFEMFRPQ